MKHILFIALALFGNLLLAQDDLPWELERYDYGHYSSQGMNLQLISDESEVFKEYYKVYKRRRSESPGDYFPTPSPYQYTILDYLSKTESPDDLFLLANFLGKGSFQALNDLADAPLSHSATLPYRFAAAIAQKNSVKAQYYINKMNEHGMISPVLKAWGFNAISNLNQNIFMTHGLQDLIGLTWALSESGRLSKSFIFSGYVNLIVQEFETENAFLEAHPSAWISPTFDTGFLENHLGNLKLSGIGFKLTQAEGNAQFELFAAVESFKGIDLECANPADAGLVSSYSYFLHQLQESSKKDSNQNLEDFKEQLAHYIEKTTVAK